jgi:rhodanese-related sulfurtransferase
MSQNLFDSIPEADSPAILSRGRERGVADGTPYAGSLFPDEAWELFQRGDAVLVDVRTTGELKNVGAVPGARHVEWASGPAMIPNPRFAEELGTVAQPQDNVLLLCRSSRRSVSAANVLAGAGWTNTFNILEGFEGASAGEGWLARDLPTA